MVGSGWVRAAEKITSFLSPDPIRPTIRSTLRRTWQTHNYSYPSSLVVEGGEGDAIEAKVNGKLLEAS